MSRVPPTARSVVVMVLLGGLGCARVPTLREDQRDIRTALIDLYTDQILDNLTRAKKLLPMLHVDYSKMTGTVDTTIRGKATASADWNDKDFGLRPAGATPPATGSVPEVASSRRTLALEGEGSRKATLNVTGDPVISNRSLYRAYLDFVRRPERFVESNSDGVEEAHVGRWSDGVYYYVPRRFAAEFMNLYLDTTVARVTTGPSRAVEYYEVMIRVVKPRDGPAEVVPGNRTLLEMELDRGIPNASGWMSAVVNGTVREFSVQPLVGAPAGAPTSKLLLLVNAPPGSQAVLDLTRSIPQERVRIYLDGYLPPPDPTSQVLEDIRHELELQRIAAGAAR